MAAVVVVNLIKALINRQRRHKQLIPRVYALRAHRARHVNKLRILLRRCGDPMHKSGQRRRVVFVEHMTTRIVR